MDWVKSAIICCMILAVHTDGLLQKLDDENKAAIYNSRFEWNIEQCVAENGPCLAGNATTYYYWDPTGSIQLNSINGNTTQAQYDCLRECSNYLNATGCEVVWDLANRGCWVHYDSVETGLDEVVETGYEVGYHLCWVFSKCYDSNERLQQVYDRWNNTNLNDGRIRPSFGDGATEVSVWIDVIDLGINIASMDFRSEIYIATMWDDDRLQYNPSDIWSDPSADTYFPIEVPESMFETFWKPDVFFKNSKSSKTHNVSQPNRMFIVEEDGFIFHKERLSLTSHCYYNLEAYPFDYQVCGYYIECYKFTEKQVKVTWVPEDNFPMLFLVEDAYAFQNEWILLERNFVENDTSDYNSTGKFSLLKGEFTIIRDIGEAIVRIYIPTSLTVLMSIVGFWIDNEDAIDRITLAVTTILTITTMNAGIREGIPKVSYLKAVDIWMLFCTCFVYMVLFQSAYVHYILRCGQKQPPKKKYETNNETNPSRSERPSSVSSASSTSSRLTVEDLETEPPKQKMYYYQLKKNTPETAVIAARQVNLLSKIFFPLAFAVFAAVYWVLYLERYNKCRKSPIDCNYQSLH